MHQLLLRAQRWEPVINILWRRACSVSAWEKGIQLMHHEGWTSLTSTPSPCKQTAWSPWAVSISLALLAARPFWHLHTRRGWSMIYLVGCGCESLQLH